MNHDVIPFCRVMFPDRPPDPLAMPACPEHAVRRKEGIVTCRSMATATTREPHGLPNAMEPS